MDVEILARLQFALTIMFHYVYPPLSIGLSLLLILMEGQYLRTKDIIYHQMAKFWTRVFAVTFAIGVATGIVMEFEFGTNWATYSRFVGDVFGSALAAEGVFAFFLESGFLALLLFGWNKVRPITHFFATIMVSLGAHFSAVWIIVANSWMQTPAGFHIVGEGLHARAEITNFWEMVFNPSTVDRLTHTVVGAWLAGAFFVMSVSAYYILKKRHLKFANYSMKIALIVAFISTIVQGILGDMSSSGVARNQPMKLAAFEGVYQTQSGAPLHLFGIPNSKEEKMEYALSVPKLLSFLAFRDFSAEIKGLNEVAKEDWPNVAILFPAYRLMVGMWVVMFAVILMTAYMWRKGTLSKSKWMLRILVISVLAPQIANQTGWVAAEMGRYPWVVQGLLRISDGISKAVTANQVLGSIIMFGVVYLFLFIVFIYLIDDKIRSGPLEEDLTPAYRGVRPFVEESKND
ncbi:MAG: cytochrome ubiquinol oxidase subunit I [Waddliaceae bacterium]